VDAVNVIYPVGSIYISTVATNPAVLFGVGTWVAIGGQFLLGTNGTYGLGSTGGSKDAVVVSHTHGVSINSYDISAGHTHYMDFWSGNAGGHSHNFTKGNTPGSGATAMASTNTLMTGTTDGVGDHGHHIAGTTHDASNGHYHYVGGNTNASGVAGTDKNMPPYIAVSIWKRTA